MLRPLVLALVLAASTAIACSEGLVNSGKGLAIQGYLAPRPATVVIYSTTPGDDRDALLAGLKKAGHRVTLVDDATSLGAALAASPVDVVITGLDGATAIATTGTTRVLPVVARSQKSSPDLRARFPVFVVDGASLGQYLRSINRLLDAK
jgi:hypothetical protein